MVSCLLCVRNEPGRSADFLYGSRRKKVHLIVVAIMLFLWFFLSGLGGYTFQNNDYHWRNALLRDLVYCHWPIVQAAGTTPLHTSAALVYYVGHWLPVALIGKVFGLQAAQHALFAWSLLGGILAFYFFFRYLGTVNIGLGLLFIFFSGLDVVGVLDVIRSRTASGRSHRVVDKTCAAAVLVRHNHTLLGF